MLILHNGVVHTLDERQPLVQALAIDCGQVVAIGDDHQILTQFGADAERFNLNGAAVIPGLTDSHIHLEKYARALKMVDCATSSREECLTRVNEQAQLTPKGEWILGHGWNQNDWQGGFGTCQELDHAAPVHPVYLTAKSLHAGWANSAALRAAGIDAQKHDPAGGRIGRDHSGAPDGILFEAAMELVSRIIPEPEPERLADMLGEAICHLSEFGLTAAHDFDRRSCFQALQILRERGDLKMRVLKSIPLEDLQHALNLGVRSGFGDDFLRLGNLKLFADGALGPRTAAMLKDYDGEPGNRGMLLLDAEEIFEYGRQAAQGGIALAVHAIGDRANHEVLNAIEQLRKFEAENLGESRYGDKPGINTQNNPQQPSRLRHRIEHVQLIHPDDASRLAKLDVIASMQPVHAISDMDMANQYWGERARFSYAWRTQIQHGARLIFGSDAPVESPDPFLGLHAALTRRRPGDSAEGPGWYPEQRLGLNETLHAYTIAPAYAAGMEDRLGRLSPGYLADLVVLERDPFKCQPDELLEIQRLATMVGGEWVYRK